jgi:DNA mismatch repair protein MSH6
MEETSVIISECTQNSLCIFDELGRGTSTYDGVAIAYGVLKYLVEEKKCKTLFTTHYHILLDEFRMFKNI